jgi:hypothetical protein
LVGFHLSLFFPSHALGAFLPCFLLYSHSISTLDKCFVQLRMAHCTLLSKAKRCLGEKKREQPATTTVLFVKSPVHSQSHMDHHHVAMMCIDLYVDGALENHVHVQRAALNARTGDM